MTSRFRSATALLSARSQLVFALLTALIVLDSGQAEAHRGRRFSVEVVNGKLQAQGINTGPDDGLPAVRPHLNVIHDHWQNVETLGTALSSLPGFDVPHFVTPLVGHELRLDLVSVRKWKNPPLMPTAETIPVLTPLDSGELLTIVAPVGETDSVALGEVLLSSNIPPGGALDLDLIYQVNSLPANEIHVLKFVVRAGPTLSIPATLRPSDPVFVLLSPDGDTPMEKLHHASLFLEAYVATIPEPTSGAMMIALLAGIVMTRIRRN